jgi:hypothetical protein
VPSGWVACSRTATGCPAGDACFFFDDQADAQALADKNGICLPAAECSELGIGYPGGGSCIGPG